MHSEAQFRARLDTARQAVSAARDELRSVETGHASKPDALAKLDAWLDSGLAAVVDPRRRQLGAESFADPSVSINDLPPLDERTAAALVLMALRDPIRAHLVGQIDAHYKAAGAGLDAAKRGKLTADLRAKLFALEVEEERVIVEAQRAGLALLRRPDINPAVLVEVL